MKKLLVFTLLVISSLPLVAQEIEEESFFIIFEEDQKMAQIANNPVAFAYKLYFQNVLTFGDHDQNTLYTNFVAPIYINEHVNFINRVMIPLETRNFSNTGTETSLGNIQYMGLFTYKDGWDIGNGNFTVGVGPSVVFNSNTFDDTEIAGDDNWALGASLLGVYRTKSFLGLISATPNWGISGDKATTMMIQYSLGYYFRNGMSIVSSPIILYNDALPDGDNWIVPFGLGVGHQFAIKEKIPMNVSFGVNYNAIRPDSMDDQKWQFQVNLLFLLPSPALGKAVRYYN
ncbi:hypothetical protein K5X82_15975 [Halosquirtibacter xylanolyticus]|uniref:hypothetical protein n=1 Tax=Halosquirtibacter xylanolyticus TaxID=3374599 RepID=UPI0037498411|nr:hypothetical protein K5X82_15975 [Prolixibacteraceae bacterium]